MRSTCVQAQRVRITAVGNNVEIVLNGIRVVARKDKDVRVGIRLCGIRVIVCIELTGAGRVVPVIASIEVGVDVVFATAFLRILLNSLCARNIDTIAKEIASLPGFTRGGLDRKSVLRDWARSHIWSNGGGHIAGSGDVAVQRFAVIRRWRPVRAKCDIGFRIHIGNGTIIEILNRFWS